MQNIELRCCVRAPQKVQHASGFPTASPICADRGDGQGVVEPAIAAAVEPVPAFVPARDVDRCGGRWRSLGLSTSKRTVMHMPFSGLTLLIGMSGTGKTAVADEIERSDSTFRALHGGARLRAMATEHPSGPVAAALAAGLAVPPEAFLEVVRSAADEFDKGTHLLMDGFPRSVEQVKLMPAILELSGIPMQNVRVVELQAPSDVIHERTARRFECSSCGTVGDQAFTCSGCGTTASSRRRNQIDPDQEAATVDAVRDALSALLPVYQVKTRTELAATAADLLDVIAERPSAVVSANDDELDIQLDCLIDAFRLHTVRRFFHQRYFEEETREVEYARRVQPDPHLETVSEHSWHLADAVLLFGPSFRAVDVDRAVQLAIAHDKLEMFIGDIDPIGRDGTGQRAHAFNEDAKVRKRRRELIALEAYLTRVPPSARASQESLHREALDCVTPEARFMKSLDKLAAIAFILVKKDGNHSDQHLRLIHRLTARNALYFDGLAAHHWLLLDRILERTARVRRTPLKAVRVVIDDLQPALFDLGAL